MSSDGGDRRRQPARTVDVLRDAVRNSPPHPAALRAMGRSIRVVAPRWESDPELAELVECARSRAHRAGELSPGAGDTLAPVLGPEARDVLAGWIRDGGYVRAVAEVVAHDPWLADQ